MTVWQLVFALWSLLLTVWPGTWQDSSLLEFILQPLMVLIMFFPAHSSPYSCPAPALGEVLISSPPLPPQILSSSALRR